MRRATDSYDVEIKDLIEAVIERGSEAGVEVADRFAYAAHEVQRRPSLPIAVQAKIMLRDSFYCGYCQRKCIPSPIMELLHGLYPKQIPWTIGWKGGATHPAFVTRSPCIDHIDPGAWSGRWGCADNLVTSCFPCNQTKGDLTLAELGWEIRDNPSESWDGLVSYYRPLWDAASGPFPSRHRAWMAALGVL